MAKDDISPLATLYTHRLHLFIPASYLGGANGRWHQIDPDTGGDKTFGAVKLSATGQEPVTHYAASTPATEAMLTKFNSVKSQMEAQGLVYWMVNAETSVLEETNHASGTVGQTFSYWDGLAALGLTTLEPEY